MVRVFVQTTIFSKALDRKGAVSALSSIEDAILENPEVGDVVAGTGGVRKLRLQDEVRRKGKRGGLRVLYLDLPRHERTYLLYVYGKDEAEDITFEEKRKLRNVVTLIKAS